MAVRYRYKGKFVSASKAARLGNLKSASKYLKTESYFKGKLESARRGYKAPIERLISKAIKIDIESKIGKPAAARRPASVKKETLSEERRREKERYRLQDIVEKAIERAYEDDIDIEEAADIYFDPDSFQYYDFSDFQSMASDYEADDYFFDFDMADLEDEDKYHS